MWHSDSYLELTSFILPECTIPRFGIVSLNIQYQSIFSLSSFLFTKPCLCLDLNFLLLQSRCTYVRYIIHKYNQMYILYCSKKCCFQHSNILLLFFSLLLLASVNFLVGVIGDFHMYSSHVSCWPLVLPIITGWKLSNVSWYCKQYWSGCTVVLFVQKEVEGVRYR